MKPVNKIALVFLCAALCVLIAGGNLLAADAKGESNWRETYDLVLRWANFLILAFLIVKFARTPLKDFLKGQKEKLAAEIGKKEKEKERATAEVKDIMTALNESETRFASLKERIVVQGKKKKEQIVDAAKAQSRQLLEETKKRVKYQIEQAKQQLKAELVDTAIELAMDRLPREMTGEDNEKFFDQFLREAQGSSSQHIL
jgi:F-type H+-transporting ATPase subunit b